MDAPTPTPSPTAPEPPTRPWRRRWAVAGLVGAVGIAGLGLGAVAAGGTDTAAVARNDRTVAAIAREMDRQLGAVTLDDLADELADLGLEVRITPTEADEAGETASGPEGSAEGSDDDDGWIVPDDGVDDGWHDHDDGFDETAATFRVEGDRITATSGDASAQAEGEAIWRRFVALIPADQRDMLVGFEVLAERGEGGYVYPDETDPTRWILGISPGLGADEDFVLIHEFAHLLTLQAEEVPPSIDDGSCPTYHTGEGCSLRGSTMAEFVARFWPKAQRDEVFAAQEAGDWDAIDAFYAEHADDFVTDYATTNPAEDLAETFTVFVLNGRPTGDTIADQKVQFLWGEPDLVELRERVRSAL